MSSKKQVVIGLLGTNLDAGTGPDRWNRWRPTLSLFQHEEILFDRLELLHDRRHQNVAEQVAADIARISPESEVRLHLMEVGDPWDFEEVYGKLQDFSLQYDFNTAEEDYLVHLTTGTHVAQICMFLLTESRHIPARLAQTSPPGRNDTAPGRYSVIDLDLSKYDKLVQRFETSKENATSYLKGGVETHNQAFNAMIGRIEQVAIASDAPLLLLGPTGSGKSHLAKRIYDLKHERHTVERDFVSINCATVRGDQAMSVLFGCKRGFAGASTERKGLLRQAHKGVLFLDEIDELGLDEQAMILDAIEHGRFYPLGADRETSSDFQLIAGASKDLSKEVREGRFRQDLFARLNLWTFSLPALADRREDIEPNIDAELAKIAQLTNKKISFATDAKKHYLRFALDPSSAWVGNFRDLNASVARLATLAVRDRITRGLVEEEITRLNQQWTAGTEETDINLVRELMSPSRVDELDRLDIVQLAEIIRVCRRSPSMSAAGKTLFGASRLRRKTANDSDRIKKLLERYDLTWADMDTAIS